ncbi:MAG TPA: carbohydrate-binding protein, partial [Gaiellaceae bacterium]|nr:carbohydrate-binding protein [Gaiellaceae bacterium]
MDRGRNATSAPAYVAAADSFSLIRLRQRRARIWLTAAGIVSLATIYVGPLAIALSRAAVAPVSTAGPLPELKLPYESFARLNVPKLHAAPVVAPVSAIPAIHAPATPRRVPVVTDSYTLGAPAPASPSTQASALANAPVVVDEAGTPVNVTTTTTTAASPPAAAQPVPAAPAKPARSLQGVTGGSGTISSAGSGDISAASGAADIGGTAPTPPPLDVSQPSAPPPSPTLDVTPPSGGGGASLGSVSTPQPSVAPSTSGAVSASPSGGSATSGGGSTPVAGTAPAGSGSSGTSGAQPGAGGGTADGPAAAGAGTSAPAGTTPPPPDPAANPGSGPSPPSAWAIDLSGTSAAHTISVASSGDDLVVTVDGAATSRPAASVASVSVAGGSGDDAFTVSGGFSVPVSLDGGAGSDTLNGPAADTTWTISGAGSGSVAGADFAGFEHLVGAPDNQDTFDVLRGGSVESVDGGAGGYDTLAVAGDELGTTPTSQSSGSVTVDGATIAYAGLEPVHLSGASVTINGSDLTLGDLMKVGPGSTPGTIEIDNFDSILTSLPLGEITTFTIAGTSSVTINGGDGGDTVEFIGNYQVPSSSLTVNAETIKVDSGVTIDVGSGVGHDITFNAISKGNGKSFVGLTSTLLGVGASIDVDGATLNANNVDFEAVSGTLSTTVNGAGQTLPGGGTLNVASTAGFDSTGTFTVAGATGTCTYTGTTATSFTGITGCTGTPADKAKVELDITQNGNSAGINYAAVQLIYTAEVNVHGASSITASGDVTMASSVDVTATANAAGGPDKGTWDASASYSKGDVVTYNGKRYDAKNDVHSATAPDSDATNWEVADAKDSSVAATVLVANSTSKLTDTSSITASSGNVKITSSLSSSITTVADSSAAGSGAGIAVGVVVTDSEAYIDSTATTPVTAKNLTVTADTNDTAPTSGTSSPKGSQGNDTKANDPTNNPANQNSNGDPNAQKNAADTKGNGLSKTSDGNENLTAALAVTVLVATTNAYIAPDDQSSNHTLDIGTGAVVVHAGASTSSSAIANAGNVKFSPDAPTFTGASASGGNLTGGSTYYYRVSATFAASGSTTVNGASQDLSGGTLTVASAIGFDDTGELTVAGATGTCLYTGHTTTQFTGITGCTGTATDGGAVTAYHESLPGPEASYTVPGGGSSNQITLNWTAVPNATGYKIYRGDSSGGELLLATVGAVTSYSDTTSTTPAGAMPTDDPSSGIAVAVAVDVPVISTHAYLAGRVTINAASTTLETVAPGSGSSTYTAHSTSGAGGGNVGFAGSIAVNVVTATATSGVRTPTPVAVNGDLGLSSTTNLASGAVADAKQSSDGSTTGIGASFALNVVNDTTTAGLDDGATLTGTKNLTATALDTDAMTTTANGGAAAKSDSLVFSAQVAISISNVTTSATIGSGAATTLTGGLTAHATQNASVTTKAVGAVKGGNAGIGLSLALTVANHLVDSQLKRDLAAAGAVSFTADGSSMTDSEATASAAGAKDKDSDTSTKDVNGKADSNLAVGNDASNKESGKDSGTSSTPKASSGEGGGSSVEVAAAAAITKVTSKSIAALTDGLTFSTTGALSLSSSANTDSTAKASGSAVDGSSLNIGAAVAIDVPTVVNEASVGVGTLVDSHGLSLAATMRNLSGDQKHSFDAEATAGAGKGKFGIAGSLALTIADVTTNAEIHANDGRGPPNDQLHGFDLSLTATSTVETTDKAKANDTDAKTVGVGAGAAILSIDDTTTATIDNGAIVQGAKNVTLSATGSDTATAYAEAGTSAASGSDFSLAADAAISLPTVTTSATIGTSGTALDATGAVTLTATQTAKATTTAKGSATTGDVVLGLALALALPDDEVTASIQRNVTATGAVSLSALGSSETATEADASASGAAGKGDDTSGKDVNGKANDQLSNANTERTDNTGNAAKTSNTDGARADTSDNNGSGSGDSNTVTVAGAVAINIATTVSHAWLADGITVTSGGMVTIKTSANTDVSAKGVGKETEAGSAGIGAGVAVNSVSITNDASTGNSTISSNGLDVEAVMTVNGDDRIQRFDGTEWQTIDQGDSFPEAPSDGDYFQLTKAAAATTTVDGASQDLSGGTLTVKNTADFASAGTFTVDGGTGTCTYTGKTATSFTGITGCTGTPDDKALVTDTTGTIVNGAGQSLGAGTLTVNDTSAFASSGSFTVAGGDGTCAYTTKTATQFQGITGCTGTPASGAAVARLAKAPGVYKWTDSTSSWDLQSTGAISTGADFPASPSTGDWFRLAEHDIDAEATSGAGGDKDKFSLAGALGLNIVHNHTDATVGGGASVSAGSGNVTVKAQSNEEDTAKGDSTAKSGQVGIGASVGINVLDDGVTHAAVENGATLTGGAALSVTAARHHTVTTENKAGSAGGDAFSPSVSIAIVDDTTDAVLGTGPASSVSGAATVQATEELHSELSADASAAGSDVAVGAAVAVSVMQTSTTANVERDLTAASLTVASDTTAQSEAKTFASAKGADDSDRNADSETSAQTTNNPNTNGKTGGSLPQGSDSTTSANSQTSSQGGDSDSGGVGIAAAVSLNWARHSNVAEIGDGTHAPTISASGAVKVSASSLVGANARAIGAAVDLLHSDTSIGAGVGINVEDVTNTASVGGGTHVTAGGITVEAVTPAGKENDFIVWGIAAAGGKNTASISAAVGVQVLSMHTTASVGKGAHLTSTEGIDVTAAAPIGLQNIALSGGLSTGGDAVGGAVAVNVLNDVATLALVDSGTGGGQVTHLDAAKATNVTASSSLNPIVPDTSITKLTLPAVSSVAVSGAAGGGDAAVTGSVIVDVFSISTHARIADGAQVNQSVAGGSDQSVSVTASDDTKIVNVAGALALSTGDAGVGIGIIVDVVNKDVNASIGDPTAVEAGGDVTVSATATEQFLEIAVEA